VKIVWTVITVVACVIALGAMDVIKARDQEVTAAALKLAMESEKTRQLEALARSAKCIRQDSL
jgi:hypothetical protein